VAHRYQSLRDTHGSRRPTPWNSAHVHTGRRTEREWRMPVHGCHLPPAGDWWWLVSGGYLYVTPEYHRLYTIFCTVAVKTWTPTRPDRGRERPHRPIARATGRRSCWTRHGLRGGINLPVARWPRGVPYRVNNIIIIVTHIFLSLRQPPRVLTTSV